MRRISIGNRHQKIATWFDQADEISFCTLNVRNVLEYTGTQDQIERPHQQREIGDCGDIMMIVTRAPRIVI